MTPTEAYRSRYAPCDECDTTTILQNHAGVPDENDWEEFGRCLVCGESLRHFDADEQTIDDQYWAKGKRAAAARVTSWISDLRELMKQHEEFTGQPVVLIDETGLHYDLSSELDDLANTIAPPAEGGPS